MEEEKQIMRHTAEEITQAFTFLSQANQSEEYQTQILYIVEYVEDLVALVEHYKDSATKSANLIYEITSKIIKLNQQSANKNKKIQQFKKMEMARKIMKELEQKKENQEG